MPVARRASAIVASLLVVSSCTGEPDDAAPDTKPDRQPDDRVIALPSVDDYDESVRLDALRSSPDELLVEAVRRSDFDLLTEAVDRGANLDHTVLGEPMLLAATSLDFAEGVRFFLDNGVDVNTTSRLGGTAAMRAADHNHAELLDELLQRGASLEQRLTIPPEPSALVYAARVDNGTESLQLLVENGVDINEPGQFGDTALYVAASAGAVENTRWLLDRGADVDATGTFGRTPEEAALATGQVETAALIAAAST